MSASSVSSVPAPPPIQILLPSTPQTPAAKTDSDSDTRTSQPVQAPLPPGQGTRIDQIA
jgi:hypothetical protein